jgi:hypothetical protein
MTKESPAVTGWQAFGFGGRRACFDLPREGA